MKKKTNKKSKKNVSKNKDKSNSKVTKKTKNSEDKQLFWILFTIAVFFAAFIIPYLWVENSKVFVYADTEWTVQDYDTFEAYHTRFPRFDASGYYHNIWLRNDPRDLDDVPMEGDFSEFRPGGILSFDKTTGECSGDLGRASIDLVSFIKDGIGATPVEIATTDVEVFAETEKDLVTCDNSIGKKTVVILRDGPTSVSQDETNKYCYTINVETCDDIRGIEAFMVKVLNDSLEQLYVE